jgi:16S rRNA (cytidine1402-2'-O)-methyltransferase
LVIQEALEAGYEVDVLPGPSAVPTALLAAGVKAAQFVFLGFLPQRRARRRRAMELYLESDTALVIFESPRRVGKLLAEAAEIFGERQGAVCLELTKKFQRVERGILAELAEEFAEAIPRGEAIVVIGGANTAPESEKDLGRLA